MTLVSTGTSVDPTNLHSKATHKIQAVVRLVPRQLASGPADLATVANYAWFQSANDTFQFQVPLHVQGKVRVQGTVTLGSDYQWASNVSNRYLDDLDQMRQAGLPDDRPFSGPLEIAFSQNDNGTRSWITGHWGPRLVTWLARECRRNGLSLTRSTLTDCIPAGRCIPCPMRRRPSTEHCKQTRSRIRGDILSIWQSQF